MWIDILRREVETIGADGKPKGSPTVAKELGVSRAQVDLALKGTYGARTDNLEKKIAMTYGNKGGIKCPVLGEILPAVCVAKWKLAKTIGMKAGNPETLKLYKECSRCSTRKA